MKTYKSVLWGVGFDSRCFWSKEEVPGPAGMEGASPQPCVAARTLHPSPLLGVLGLPGVVRMTQEGRVVSWSQETVARSIHFLLGMAP